MPERAPWWGPVEVEEGRVALWRLGPLSLYAHHLPGEWRLAWESLDDPLAGHVEVTPDTGLDDLPPPLEPRRFGMTKPGAGLDLTPTLADRPVVSRPEHRLEVPPGHETTLFVSTPVWVRVRGGEPPVTLAEVPVLRSSDTWFGPNPRSGELCYASRTFFRTRFENVPVRPHRAITVLRVRNRADGPLMLDRVLMPVPQLSLYCDRDGRLWTEAVGLDHEGDGAAPLGLEEGPPAEAGPTERVAGPRTPHDGNRLVRAFSFIFGG